MDTKKSMKRIAAIEKEIIAEFQALPDIDAKYSHLFQLGEALPALGPNEKNAQTEVSGCQSTLWFKLRCQDGCLHLDADSDSMVVKGIAALLVRLIEGRQPEEIESLNMDFIDALKIWKLASDRNNGLMAMLDHIKQQARELNLQISRNGPDQNQ